MFLRLTRWRVVLVWGVEIRHKSATHDTGSRRPDGRWCVAAVDTGAGLHNRNLRICGACCGAAASAGQQRVADADICAGARATVKRRAFVENVGVRTLLTSMMDEHRESAC